MKIGYIRKVMCLVTILSILFAMPILAEEETVLLPEGQSVSYNMEAIEPRGYLIATRVASIANNEDGTLDVLGQIIAHTTLDYASITLYVDRYDPDRDDWINLDHHDIEFTIEKDGELVMGTPTVSYTLAGTDIIPGYYYRLRGTYIAKKEGRKETLTATTDGVLLTKIK